MSKKVFFVVFLLSLLFFITPSPTQAIPFTKACVFSDTRPSCEPIDKNLYNPNAYSQVPTELDCGNYCFGSSRPEDKAFTSDPILNQTTVSCGDPLIAKFSLINEVWGDLKDHHPKLEEQYQYSVAGFTSLSLDNETRSTTNTWWRLINELGSVFSNLRNAEGEEFTYLDYGLNERTLSFESQLQNRLEYCQYLSGCQVDANRDADDRKAPDLPTHRCTNFQPYDAYPNNPNMEDIVHEKDVCDYAQGIFASAQGSLTRTFLQSDATFQRRFLAINSTFKSRDLMVVCSDKVYDNVSSIANMFLREKQTFDCQEFLIPPGLVAACQGIWRQYQALSPLSTNQAVADELKTERKELASINDQSIVKYKAGWFGNPSEDQINTTIPSHRNLMYARRINAEDQPTNWCVDTGIPEAEAYGDLSLNIETSDPTSINTDTSLNLPEQGKGASVVQRSFIIAPAGFQQCFDQLAYQIDDSFVKQSSANKEFNEAEAAYSTQDIIHPSRLGFNQEFGEQCRDVLDEKGNRIPLPDGSFEQECQNTHSLSIDNERPEDAFTTEGGTVIRRLFLDVFKKFFTSWNAKDYAGHVICDWFAYTHGLPIPEGCRGSLSAGGGSGAGNLCREGRPGSECAVSKLEPYFSSVENATIASRACQRESGGYTAALNDSCLSGGKDFSVGLFQINLWATRRCEDRGFNPWSHNIDEQKRRFDSGEACVVGNHQALIECIVSFGGDPREFDPSASAPEANYFQKNIEWAANRACGYPNARPTCDWNPWKTKKGCQIR